jgi:hypothetical protein
MDTYVYLAIHVSRTLEAPDFCRVTIDSPPMDPVMVLP